MADGPTVNKYVGDFIKTEVDNFLHKNPLVTEVMLQKIQDSEKERKAIAGVTKLARERAKKANLHNRKLRDCRFHLSDGKGKEQETDSVYLHHRGRLCQRLYHQKPRRKHASRIQLTWQASQFLRTDQESGL